MEGDDIDVEKFPTPMWHDKDGGRYIGTGSYNVTRDPDSDWINIGTYRVKIHNKKQPRDMNRCVRLVLILYVLAIDPLFFRLR